jgi:hypothetical protein
MIIEKNDLANPMQEKVQCINRYNPSKLNTTANEFQAID